MTTNCLVISCLAAGELLDSRVPHRKKGDRQEPLPPDSASTPKRPSDPQATREWDEAFDGYDDMGI